MKQEEEKEKEEKELLLRKQFLSLIDDAQKITDEIDSAKSVNKQTLETHIDCLIKIKTMMPRYYENRPNYHVMVSKCLIFIFSDNNNISKLSKDKYKSVGTLFGILKKKQDKKLFMKFLVNEKLRFCTDFYSEILSYLRKILHKMSSCKDRLFLEEKYNDFINRHIEIMSFENIHFVIAHSHTLRKSLSGKKNVINVVLEKIKKLTNSSEDFCENKQKVLVGQVLYNLPKLLPSSENNINEKISIISKVMYLTKYTTDDISKKIQTSLIIPYTIFRKSNDDIILMLSKITSNNKYEKMWIENVYFYFLYKKKSNCRFIITNPFISIVEERKNIFTCNLLSFLEDILYFVEMSEQKMFINPEVKAQSSNNLFRVYDCRDVIFPVLEELRVRYTEGNFEQNQKNEIEKIFKVIQEKVKNTQTEKTQDGLSFFCPIISDKINNQKDEEEEEEGED